MKSVASALILTFAYSQLVWAADVRQLLTDAENSFLTMDDTRRPGGSSVSSLSPSSLQTSQSTQQSAVDQQQTLQDLSQTNFSLTTQNGDILKYVGDKLSQVQRADGTLLNNISLSQDGTIQNADLKLSDGSVQIYQSGQVVGYQTPDGTQMIYENGRIQKTVKNGIETTYSYIQDAQGAVTQTVLENSQNTTTYDNDGKLRQVYDKTQNRNVYFDAGVIQKIVNADGTGFVFNQTVQSDGSIVVTPAAIDSGSTYDSNGKLVLQNEAGYFTEPLDVTPATSFSATSTSYGREAQNVTTGGYGWMGADPANDYLTADLGKVADLDHLVYDNRYPGSTTWQNWYSIQGSTDGVNWTTFYEASDQQSSDAAAHVIDLKGQSARYLKFENTSFMYSEGNVTNDFIAKIGVFEAVKKDGQAHYAYDDQGRLAEKSHYEITDGGTQVLKEADDYEYDDAGRLSKETISSVDAQGQKNFSSSIVYAYDGASDRIVSKDFYSADASGQSWLSKTESMTYDDAGRVRTDQTTEFDAAPPSAGGSVADLVPTAALSAVSADTSSNVRAAFDGIGGDSQYGWIISGSQNPYFLIDLKSAADLDYLTYDNRYPAPFGYPTTWQTDFSINGSLDGQTWQALAAESGLDGSNAQDWRFDVSGASARYLKIASTTMGAYGPAGPGFQYIGELGVYGLPSPQAGIKSRQTVEHVYDANGRLVEDKTTSDDNSGGPAAVTTAAYAYDNAGRLLSVVKKNYDQPAVDVTSQVGFSATSDIYGRVAQNVAPGGNIYGWMGADPSGSDSLTADLGGPVELDHLIYDNRYLGGNVWQNAYAIEGSLDGQNWTVVASQSDLSSSDAAANLIDAKGTTVRYLRFSGSALMYGSPTNFFVSKVQIFEAGKKAAETDYVRDASGAAVSLENYSIDENGLKTLLGVTDPPAPPPSTATADFKQITYNADHSIRQILTAADTRLNFENGLLKTATDAQGAAVDFGFAESFLGNLLGSTITQNGLSSTYDQNGDLSSVKTGDMTIHYRKDAAGALVIDFIEKADGTELSQLGFDASGAIQDATITTPDGEIRTYVGGKLIQDQKPDDTTLFFANEKLSKVQTPQKLTYNFSYVPNGIQAILDPSTVPDATTAVEMDYDANFNLTKEITQNRQIIDYLNNRIDSIQTPSESPKVFHYVLDAGSNVLSYSVTQDNTESFYDADDHLLKVVISPTTGNPHMLEIQYQYDKIRRILKDGVLTFVYTYAFDADGQELTEIQDLEEKTLKTYKNGLLLTSLDQDMTVLSTYSYDADSRVSRVVVGRLGRTLHTYDYAYDGADTVVTDETGTVRTYGTAEVTPMDSVDDQGNVIKNTASVSEESGKLLFMQKDNEKFQYGYTVNPDGEEIVQESLIQKNLSDGSVVSYKDGKIDTIRRPDGIEIGDIVLDSDQTLDQAIATLSDGTRLILGPDGVIGQVAADGALLYFENGRLSKAITPSSKEIDYSYTLDGNGQVSQTLIQAGDAQLKYNAQGYLQGLALPQYQDLSQIYQSVTHAYSGGDNGPNEIDGDFNTADYAYRSGNNSSIRIEDAQIFQTPQTLTQLTYRLAYSGWSNANYDNSIGGYYDILYQVAGDSTWHQVPGVNFGQSAGGNHNPSNISSDSGIKTVNVSLDNVVALKATVYMNENGNNQPSGDIKAWVYEMDYTVADKKNYAFSPSIDAQGNVTGYSFSGYAGRINFDSNGHLVSGTPPTELQKAADYLDGSMKDFALLPYKAITQDTIPAAAGDWARDAEESIPDSQAVVLQEYSTSGVLQTQTKGDQTVTVFGDDNKPAEVLDSQGNVLIEYSYDANGNPSKVYLKNARDTLPDEVAKAKQDIESQRDAQLLSLVQQKNLAYQDIQISYEGPKQQLQDDLKNLQNEFQTVSDIKVSGKKAKSQKGDALNQIGGGMDQVRGTLTTLSAQEADAYAALDAQIKSVSDQIETDSQNALTALAQQEADLKQSILRQEVSPVIYDYYRRILGRDPSSTEYQYWIDKLDYDTGKVIIGQNVTSSDPLPGSSVAFNGQNAYLTAPDSPDWAFGSGDFTVDTWVRFNSLAGESAIFSQGNSNTDFADLEWNGVGHDWEFRFFTGNAIHASLIANDSLNVNTWYHVALVKKGTTWSFYRDGVLEGSATDTTVYPDYGGPLFIGAYGYGGNVVGRYFNGQMDELRISSSARWASGFTPSTLSYDIDTDTKFLLRTANNTFQDAALSRPLSVYGGVSADSVDYKISLKTTPKTTPILADLTASLKDYINALPELAERTTYVNDIKTAMHSLVADYLSKSDADKLAFAQTLGLSPSDLIALSDSDAQKILTWLDSRSLHFGQSAFISLETLLDQKGISYNREELAEKAILIDILTGVISPLDDGDLVISVFALNEVAALYGLNLSGTHLDWGDLKALYDADQAVIGQESYQVQTPGQSVSFGNGAGYLTSQDSSGTFDFGTKDFTIEAWVKLAGASGIQTIASKDTNPSGWIFYVQQNAIGLYSNWNYAPPTASVNLTPGTWYDVAVSRQGNTLRYFLNGVVVGIADVTGISYGGGSSVLRIGAYSSGSSGRFNGNMDGLRISDNARYTADFAPSTVAPTVDSHALFYLAAASGSISDVAGHRAVTVSGSAVLDASDYKLTIPQTAYRSVITRYPVSIADPSLLTDAQKQDIIDHPDKYNPRIIAHINGNHFVIITGMTDDTITYIDPGIGSDHQNESLTVAKEGFLKVWDGNVTMETALIQNSQEKTNWDYLKRLSDVGKPMIGTDTRTVTGAGSSIKLNGSGDYLSVPGSADFDFGTGDFTVEAWVCYNSQSIQTFMGTEGANWLVIFNGATSMSFYRDTNTDVSWTTAARTNGVWYHFAFVRSGNTLTFYQNGVSQGSKDITGWNISTGSQALQIGRWSPWGTANASFDGISISKGIARYTADFTPPATRGQADQYTKLLITSDPLNGIKDISASARTVTVNGSARVDAANYAESIQSVITEKIIIRYPASIADPSSLTDAQKQDIIDNPDKYAEPVDAHINGGHLVTVIQMTGSSVTYTDGGQTFTVSKADFLKVWDGDAAAKDIAIQAANPKPASTMRILSEQEAQSIRGAFWGSILSLVGWVLSFTPLAFLTPAFQLISAAVSAIEGDFITAISSLVTFGMGNMGSFFKDAFSGLTHALGPLGTALSNIGTVARNIYNGVVGFFNTALGFLPGIGGALQGIATAFHTTIGAQIVNMALSTGLHIAVSRGLESLGVSPQVAGFLGGLTSGAIIGALQGDTVSKAGVKITQAENIQSSVQTVMTLQEVGQLGAELHINPALTNIVGLSIAAIQGQFIDKTAGSLSQAFSNIKPELLSSLAQYGVQELGTSLGLDPRISTLIGTPISAVIGANYQPGVDAGLTAITAVENGLLSGAVSLGINYATQDIDPLLGSLTASAVTGAISGALHLQQTDPSDPTKIITPDNIFDGLYNSFNNSVLSFSKLGIMGTDAWSQAQYIQRITNFSDIIQQEGLGQALEDTATQVLTENAINSILTAINPFTGQFFKSVNEFMGFEINNGDIETRNGINYKKISEPNGDYQLYSSDGKTLIEIRRGNQVLNGTFGKDQTTKNFGLTTGTIAIYDSAGKLVSKQYIENGWNVEQDHYSVDPLSGQEATDLIVKPPQGLLGITFDEFGNYSDADLVNVKEGYTAHLVKGEVSSFDYQLNQSQVFANGTFDINKFMPTTIDSSFVTKKVASSYFSDSDPASVFTFVDPSGQQGHLQVVYNISKQDYDVVTDYQSDFGLLPQDIQAQAEMMVLGTITGYDPQELYSTYTYLTQFNGKTANQSADLINTLFDGTQKEAVLDGLQGFVENYKVNALTGFVVREQSTILQTAEYQLLANNGIAINYDFQQINSVQILPEFTKYAPLQFLKGGIIGFAGLLDFIDTKHKMDASNLTVSQKATVTGAEVASFGFGVAGGELTGAGFMALLGSNPGGWAVAGAIGATVAIGVSYQIISNVIKDAYFKKVGIKLVK